MTLESWPSARRQRILLVAEGPQLRRAFADALGAFDVRAADPTDAITALRDGADYDGLVYDIAARRDEALAFVDALTVDQWARLIVIIGSFVRVRRARASRRRQLNRQARHGGAVANHGGVRSTPSRSLLAPEPSVPRPVTRRAKPGSFLINDASSLSVSMRRAATFTAQGGVQR